MLGRFLELSLVTPDIQASLNFYGKLGFSEAEVGEAWSHPYAVLTDGRICLGLHQESELHQEPQFASSLTFVKPDLFKHLAQFEGLNLPFEFRRLGGDVFNEIGWLDPAGQLIRLVEARTFSPTKRLASEPSACGYFLEIALPAPSSDVSKDHWERLGFVGMDEADANPPHIACTSDTIDIGLYDPLHVREPTLRFEVDDLDATLARLETLGIKPDKRLPAALKTMPAIRLHAPEGTPLLLSAAG